MSDGPQCAFVDCGNSAVGSNAVRGTMWFASHSRLLPQNGEAAHWEIGGTVVPVDVLVTIHVCRVHGAIQEVV